MDALTVDMPKGIQLTAEVVALLQSNAEKALYKSGGFSTDEVQAVELQKEAERLDDIINNTESTPKEVRAARTELEVVNNNLERQLDALYALEGGFESGSSRIVAAIAELAAGQGTTVTQTSSGGSSSGGSNYVCSVKDFYARQGKCWCPCTGETTPLSFAGGGVIDEEIWGIGRCSGKRYRFGESGEEAIIPLKEFQTGGSLSNTGYIGQRSHIFGGGQRGHNVGRFEGISAQRYSNYTSNLYGAQQTQMGAQEERDELGDFTGQKQYRSGTSVYVCNWSRRRWTWPIYSNTPEYNTFLAKAGELDTQLNAAKAVTE